MSRRLFLNALCEQPTFDLHGPCTHSPRCNTARRAHQTSLAAAPPDQVAPHDMIGHPRARMFLWERPLPPSTGATGIPRIGEELPRDSMILYRVFVSYECLFDAVCENRHTVGIASCIVVHGDSLKVVRRRSSIALRPWRPVCPKPSMPMHRTRCENSPHYG
jgi:hypothetical protein